MSKLKFVVKPLAEAEVPGYEIGREELAEIRQQLAELPATHCLVLRPWKGKSAARCAASLRVNLNYHELNTLYSVLCDTSNQILVFHRQ